MATITFTLSSATLTEFVDAQAFHYGYQTTIQDIQNPGQTIANPETKAQFAKRMAIKFYLKERIHSYRNAQALAAADEADPDIT